MNALRVWWSGRSGRERALLGLAAAALALALAWQAVVLPVGRARSGLERAVATRADALAQLEAARAALRAKAGGAAALVPAGRLLTLALAWQAVVLPVARARSGLERAVATRADALAQLEAARAALRAKAGGAAAPVPAGRLLTHTERLLGEAGLAGAATRIEPLAPDGARVSVSGAPFDALLAWLEALAASGVAVPELELHASAPGSVDGSAVLRASAPP